MAAKDYEHIVKLLVLGDANVGKSALTSSFCDSPFDSRLRPAVGVDFKVRIAESSEGRRLKIQVWDTTQQDVTNEHFSGAMGTLLVYSIADRDSFERMPTWIDQLNLRTDPKCPRILVGNAPDVGTMAGTMAGSSQLSQASQVERCISSEEGEALARQHGMHFFETFPRTGEGVNSAFMHISELAMHAHFDMAITLLREQVRQSNHCRILSLHSNTDSGSLDGQTEILCKNLSGEVLAAVKMVHHDISVHKLREKLALAMSMNVSGVEILGQDQLGILNDDSVVVDLQTVFVRQRVANKYQRIGFSSSTGSSPELHQRCCLRGCCVVC